MDANAWTWAPLTDEQRQALEEAERTLGAELLLAYARDQGGEPRHEAGLLDGLRPTRLDESQMDCLTGLEHRLDAVVVAYERAAGNPAR
jgi:hypothetical protein